MVLLSLKSRINTARFSILKNEDLFKSLTLKNDFIIWKNKDGDSVELSYTDILYLLQTTEESTSFQKQKQIYHNHSI